MRKRLEAMSFTRLVFLTRGASYLFWCAGLALGLLTAAHRMMELSGQPMASSRFFVIMAVILGIWFADVLVLNLSLTEIDRRLCTLHNKKGVEIPSAMHGHAKKTPFKIFDWLQNGLPNDGRREFVKGVIRTMGIMIGNKPFTLLAYFTRGTSYVIGLLGFTLGVLALIPRITALKGQPAEGADYYAITAGIVAVALASLYIYHQLVGVVVRRLSAVDEKS